MRSKLILLALLVVIVAVVAGCGGKGGTVSSMWSDVPTLPDSKKADINLPLPMRLAIQALMRASANDSDVDLDKFDFIGYTTSQSPQEITEFYSQERMAEEGWNLSDQPGCTAASGAEGFGGGMCFFGKDSGNQQSMLIIAIGQEEGKDKTQVYYVRFDGDFKTGSN